MSGQTSTGPKLRLFIGSGEASVLERKTLIYSLRKHTRRPLEIFVFNGTHNAIEFDGQDPVPAPMSLKVKYRNITEFSLYRFLIPQICRFEGKAIFLDSDMICLADIGELFDSQMDGNAVLAKANTGSRGGWDLSVMLIDCSRCRFDLEKIIDETDRNAYSFSDFTSFGQKYLNIHPMRVGNLDPKWNVFDRRDSQTKLIHFTNLLTQPWKHSGHPFEDLWFHYFNEAQAAGVVTPRDIELSLLRSYVRQDILKRKAAGSPRFLDRLGAVFAANRRRHPGTEIREK
jgi:hypothetical protein